MGPSSLAVMSPGSPCGDPPVLMYFGRNGASPPSVLSKCVLHEPFGTLDTSSLLKRVICKMYDSAFAVLGWGELQNATSARVSCCLVI